MDMEIFISILRCFRHLEAKKYKLYIRVFLSRYVTAVIVSHVQVPGCAKIRGEKVGGCSIADLTRMTVAELGQVLSALEADAVQA